MFLASSFSAKFCTLTIRHSASSASRQVRKLGNEPVLGVGCWALGNVGRWVLAVGQLGNVGRWALGNGHWVMGVGQWAMALGNGNWAIGQWQVLGNGKCWAMGVGR
jgi:hypothetical protein